MPATKSGCGEPLSPENGDVTATRVVVDASVVVKWFDVDERYLVQAHHLLNSHLDGRTQILLSELVPYEVGSALLKIPTQDFEWPTDSLWTSDFVWVTLDPESAEAARGLAISYGLSYYDATYLALALREGALLVSDDQLLLDAAETEGVGLPLEQIPTV